MARCHCCGVEARMVSDLDERHTEEDENGREHEHSICEWCKSNLPWVIVELSCHGFYVHNNKQETRVTFTQARVRDGVIAGEWTGTNVDDYPVLAERREKLGISATGRKLKGATARPRDEGDPAEIEARARLRAFFFAPDPAYGADGRLVASASGREWF